MTLRYTWRDGDQVVEERAISLARSPSDDTPITPASVGVSEDWIIQESRQALREADELLDTGRPEEARKALAAQLERLRSPTYR